ncbi:hypothetical protein [Microseira sp. BLCC-F43]|jgi:hypothetical protein|uniref:hypothetical protein n=1 Tax=Microseira sp. BLCC-F43 TaxID=3153602 RepID=UPI0035B814CF
MTTENSYYPKSCQFTVPITLKVPIYLELEVVGKPTVCRNNGHKTDDSEPVLEKVES